MSSFLWPSDDGWPYPDAERELDDGTAVLDDDLLDLKLGSQHLLRSLEPLERHIITAHYGLDGTPSRSMKQLQVDLGLPRADLRDALGSGLTKLRAQLR